MNVKCSSKNLNVFSIIKLVLLSCWAATFVEDCKDPYQTAGPAVMSRFWWIIGNENIYATQFSYVKMFLVLRSISAAKQKD